VVAVAIGVLTIVACSDATVDINKQITFDGTDGSFKLTSVPNGFVYASADAENPTVINYTVTFTDYTGCSVTSYDALGVEVADSGDSGTTHAIASGEYLKVACV
jgi:hypothetical protein